MSSLTFSFILFGLKILLFWQSIRFKKFRIHVAEKNFTAQIKSRDNSVGRWFKFENGVYFKPEYMNKQSKDVKYFKLDWRNKSKDWTYGFTTRSTNEDLTEYATFFSAGMVKKKEVGKWSVEVSFDGYLPPKDDGSIDGNMFEFEDKFNIGYKISEKVSIYNMGEIYRLKGQQFYKAKIGINWRL